MKENKKIKEWKYSLLLLGLLLIPGSIIAYSPVLHKQMSLEAVSRNGNVLNNDEFLKKALGFRVPSEQIQPQFRYIFDTIPLLLMQGAYDEDHMFPIKSNIHHFYDPTRNKALFLQSGTLIGQEYAGHLSFTSPDWSLEDKSQIGAFDNYTKQAQEHSYADARNTYFEALTSIDINERKEKWSKLFKSLGHVIHHIQDMAQPAHVRNDAHLDLGPKQFHDISPYEQLTGEPDWLGVLYYDGYPDVYYTTPRHYWENEQQRGLAQFTNQNFYSKDTIYPEVTTEYPWPLVGYHSPIINSSQAAVIESVASLCSSFTPPCEPAFSFARW